MPVSRKNVLLLKVVLLCLAGLLLYRIGSALFIGHNFHFTCHVIVIVALLSWLCATLYLWTEGEKPEAAAIRRNEAISLMGFSIILLALFVLAGQGRLLHGGEHWNTFPFLPGISVFSQSLLAVGLYLVPIWLIHLFLNIKIPLRASPLLPMVTMLVGTGLVLLYRLGPDIAIKSHKAGFTFLFWNQYISFLFSLIAFMVALLYLTPQRIERLTRFRYIYAFGSIVLICLTAVVGTEMHGRRLSINLGVMNFQSVELVKIMALFFMVSYFRFEGGFMERGRHLLGLPRGRYLAPYFIMWILVLLPIFLQKDLGPTALLFTLFLLLFYLGSGSGISALSGIIIMVAAGALSYSFGYPSMVRTRLDMWFEPFLYSQNIAESLWAAASGGWFGVGPGAGMAYKIPVVWSDFNFAAIVEEWGFFGALSVLVCFASLAYVSVRSAQRCNEPYLQLLGTGLGCLWLLQTMVIVGGNLALLPLTGITLPFISFGGSSLIMNFISLALIMQISSISMSKEVLTTLCEGKE
ncbi:related to cell division protein (FtsW) [Desulfotalea psychrophila LSv54]|uniref:Related to cell division protein (FtsW) n=1 Tax=Desulfotalea psychrophila (strain LSv54 / DSM 12343) TaxID=177439 RepID=Q6AKH1_DESPS|nr:related to cell division protein (FtsW) [Desulfotalea psychrophila LSv54]